MRLSKYALILACLCLCTACTGAAQSEPTSLSVPTLSPTATAPSSSAVVATPLSTAEHVLSLIPHCDKIQVLDQPVKFVWPNVEKRIKELEGSDWGYYSCAQPTVAVSTFYREQMPKPPRNLREANWVERPEGTLGVFFNSATQIWIYLWVVPQSPGGQTSYVIVAVADGEVFEPECRVGPFQNA